MIQAPIRMPSRRSAAAKADRILEQAVAWAAGANIVQPAAAPAVTHTVLAILAIGLALTGLALLRSRV